MIVRLVLSSSPPLLFQCFFLQLVSISICGGCVLVVRWCRAHGLCLEVYIGHHWLCFFLTGFSCSAETLLYSIAWHMHVIVFIVIPFEHDRVLECVFRVGACAYTPGLNSGGLRLFLTCVRRGSVTPTCILLCGAHFAILQFNLHPFA